MAKQSQRKTGIYRSATPNAGWRQFQSSLKQQRKRRNTFKRLPRYLLVLFVLVLLTKGIFSLLEFKLSGDQSSIASITPPHIETLTRTTLEKLLNPNRFINLVHKDFTMQAGILKFNIMTSIDPALQQVILDHMDREHSQWIGFVAMDPDTGRVLSMVSYDRSDPSDNPCLKADFPAASLFKIITVSAAIEKCGFSSETPVCFNGGKYTLYKSQLTNRTTKYTNETTLEDAFAESINPVFGKIGRNRLGKSVIEHYAKAFGFNRHINFDLPMSESVVTIEDKPYNWAEVACGFNHTTKISPLHGAMIASAVINHGKLMDPTIVDAVAVDNHVVYRRKTSEINRAIKSSTANAIIPLMNATVSDGTARRIFRGAEHDPILSRLDIGGKTGSINDNPEHIKFDWFIGFATDRHTGKRIVASVLVAHKRYIGTRAAEYFRLAIRQYFSSHS